ncbi:MAG: 4-hydroxybenzoate octaprenyltransferase, partial [Rhodobacterales bacterium]|nr:4-hydroxybenzoate octaprenyltransferase [Rhodobacterales bacterium]
MEPLPEAKDQIFDAVDNNWVDVHAPIWSRPFLKLSRMDRPIGTWLLLLPCWWGLLIGILNTGSPKLNDLWIFVGCAVGAVLMRGSGCTWNDINDRKIDAKVARTKLRPIPSGSVSVKKAALWMVAQALMALFILLTFNTTAIILGFIAILPVAIYPFAKRFTWWPQFFLGIAFNWGVLLAFAASTNFLAWPCIILYLAGISWTLFYDTIYAHQDKEDDALVGVKSTAILFADSTKSWLFIFATLAAGLMILSFLFSISGLQLFIAITGALFFYLHMVRQVINLDIQNSQSLLDSFRSNRNAGFI